MESHSLSACRRLVCWQGLLLAVSLINFWFLPTADQVIIKPLSAEKGKNVELQIFIFHLPHNITEITWYKGKGTNKNRTIAFVTKNSGTHVRDSLDGRVVIDTDGSLTIKNITKNDRGWYTLVIRLGNSKEYMSWILLAILEPLRVPTIIASNTTVTENKDAVELTCYTNAMTTRWLLNDIYLQPSERIKIYRAGRILTIDPVKREDAGSYQCIVFNQVRSARSAPFELNVKFD